jgi:hypothetical protein
MINILFCYLAFYEYYNVELIFKYDLIHSMSFLIEIHIFYINLILSQ